MPVSWFEHQGNRILFADFRNLDEEQAIVTALEQKAATEAAKEPVLLLSDVTGAVFGQRLMGLAKANARAVNHLVRKRAILGVDGVKSVLLASYNRATGSVPMKPFDSREPALVYLTADERPTSQSRARVPQVRAATQRDRLAFLEEFRPGTVAELRKVLPLEVMDAVENGAATGWTSVVLDGQLLTATVRLLGADSAREFWRKFGSTRFIRTPAAKVVFECAVGIFGLGIPALLKVLPVAFRQTFRDFGELRVEVMADQGTVTIADLAPEVLVHRDAYGVLFHGMLLSVFDISKAEPQLDFRVKMAERQYVARLSW